MDLCVGRPQQARAAPVFVHTGAKQHWHEEENGGEHEQQKPQPCNHVAHDGVKDAQAAHRIVGALLAKEMRPAEVVRSTHQAVVEALHNIVGVLQQGVSRRTPWDSLPVKAAPFDGSREQEVRLNQAENTSNDEEEQDEQEDSEDANATARGEVTGVNGVALAGGARRGGARAGRDRQGRGTGRGTADSLLKIRSIHQRARPGGPRKSRTARRATQRRMW
eukprot:scaffold20659_cov64-Phaeocystis_antarctica.AAC.12